MASSYVDHMQPEWVRPFRGEKFWCHYLKASQEKKALFE